MLQEIQESKLISLFGEYCIIKCKGFSQNYVMDKHKLNVFLSASYHFSNLREINVFIKKVRKLGLISATMLQPCIRALEYFLAKDSCFKPNMDEKEYLQYFFELTKTHKPTTIKNHISCLNIFLRFLGQNGYKARNIASIKMRFLREKTLPSYLNESNYRLFLQEIQKMRENSLAALRNKLAILLVYYTGIRTREVANITFADIKEEIGQYVIKIKGKCSMQRFVSVKKDFIESVYIKYLQARRHITSIYLFQTKNCDIAPNINITLKPLLHNINCIQHRGNKLHLLRHSFASFVYRKSKDLLLTQKILGHSNISSTQIYVHLDSYIHEKVASYF